MLAASRKKPIGWVIMPALFRVGACRAHFYANDHDPPHVHVRCPEGAAVFLLGDSAREVRLDRVRNIGPPILRRIAAEIRKRHGECVEAWRTRNGEQDTVGPGGR